MMNVLTALAILLLFVALRFGVPALIMWVMGRVTNWVCGRWEVEAAGG